ncbi:putative chromosome-partitioning protein ParB [Caulifigura coniformis]|uniref:Putative chromosome-partitioning protein ParB n=2 Tax=Caulifigura coniformis TaxID=2527983 RepID=A0A517SA72_9PLAN|nr:putative chromosome-partitioning protein ParB [Caulifigura coniformis]
MSKATSTMQPAPVQLVAIDQIDDGPNPLRLDLEIESDEMQELVESVKAQGVLQPIGVYPSANRFVQLFGFRRKLAASIAGFTEIPASILKAPSGPSEVLVMQLQENIQRLDVDPVRYGETLKALQDELGCTQQELARVVSLNPVKVTRLLAAARLPEEIKALVGDKRLPVSTALQLGQLGEVERSQLLRQALAGQLTRDEATRRRRAISRPPSTTSAVGRVTVQLDHCRRVTVTGVSATFEEWIRALQDAVADAKQGIRQRLTFDTYRRRNGDCCTAVDEPMPVTAASK